MTSEEVYRLKYLAGITDKNGKSLYQANIVLTGSHNEEFKWETNKITHKRKISTTFNSLKRLKSRFTDLELTPDSICYPHLSFLSTLTFQKVSKSK